MSSGKEKRKMTHEEEENEKETAMVQNLIGRCMVQNLNPQESIDVLYKEHKIEPSFTKTVWQELEKQSQDSFNDYYSRLAMKKQAEMTSPSNIPPITFDLGASSSSLEKKSTGRNEEMQMVKNLIEQCLVHYMSQQQVMDILHQKENIDPEFTKTVWHLLEEQNEEFFMHYLLRLTLIEQIIKFNSLLEQQATLMNQLLHQSEVQATELVIDRHRPGTLRLRLQVPPIPNIQLPSSNFRLTLAPPNSRPDDLP